MTKNVSFSRIENEVVRKFRQNLSLAESTEDVKKFFFYTIQDLIREASEGKLMVEYEDIAFDPDQEEYFAISRGLLEDDFFSTLWQDSDLHAIVKRLALKGFKTHKHLAKHREKTEAKMYHLEGR